MQFESDNENSISRCSKEENSDLESLDADEPSSAKQKGNAKQKKARKSKWQDHQIHDLVDVICLSKYFKKGLIFTNTKNSKNGETYEQVLKQLKERYLSQGQEHSIVINSRATRRCKRRPIIMQFTGCEQPDLCSYWSENAIDWLRLW